MVCAILAAQSWIDWVVYPTTCMPSFYAIILAGLFVILTFILYFTDKERILKADMIGPLAISSAAMTILAFIGGFIVDSYGNVMIPRDILLGCIAFMVVFVSIWFLGKD